MKRNYSLLLVSQFLSAFGDNAILAVILGQFLFRHQQGIVSDMELGTVNAFYTSILFVPYVLLAPFAGFLGDRYAKTRVLILGNAVKCFGTFIAFFTVVSHNDFFQSIGYLIVGAGACIYSPAKYGILVEILPKKRLVKANGMIEMLTIVAILVGTVSGAKAIDTLSSASCFILLLGIYGFAFCLNFAMTPTKPQANIKLSKSFEEFKRHFFRLLGDRRIAFVLLGTGLFWICGAVMKMNFQPWGIRVLGYETNTEISMLGIWLSLGIMSGSMLSGQIHRVSDLSGVRRYGIMMSILIACLAMTASNSAVIALLILNGTFAGLFLIPLNSALQAESDSDKIGKSIALQNFIENLAMLCGGIFIFSVVKVGASPQVVFILLAVLVAVISSFLFFPALKGKEEC